MRSIDLGSIHVFWTEGIFFFLFQQVFSGLEMEAREASILHRSCFRFGNFVSFFVGEQHLMRLRLRTSGQTSVSELKADVWIRLPVFFAMRTISFWLASCQLVTSMGFLFVPQHVCRVWGASWLVSISDPKRFFTDADRIRFEPSGCGAAG